MDITVAEIEATAKQFSDADLAVFAKMFGKALSDSALALLITDLRLEQRKRQRVQP